MPSSRIAVGLALLAITAAPLRAQIDDAQPSYWIGVGLGTGSAGIECVECSPDRANALAGHVRFGTALGPSFDVGAELNLWRRSEGNVDEQIRVLSADLRYHPPFVSALALRAGFGYTEYTATHHQPGNFEAPVTTNGLTALAGLSFAIRVARSVSVDPYVSYARQLQGELALSGASSGEDARVDLLQFGLGLTWYQGARD